MNVTVQMTSTCSYVHHTRTSAQCTTFPSQQKPHQLLLSIDLYLLHTHHYHGVVEHDGLRHDVEGAALALVRDDGDEHVAAVAVVAFKVTPGCMGGWH